MMSVKIKGTKNEIEAQMRKAALRAVDDLATAMHAEALAILAASQKEVPVDTGILRRSGFVPPPTMTNNTVEQKISYGTDYAWIVHELPYRHVVGKRFFLSDPLTRAATGMVKRLAARIKALQRTPGASKGAFSKGQKDPGLSSADRYAAKRKKRRKKRKAARRARAKNRRKP